MCSSNLCSVYVGIGLHPVSDIYLAGHGFGDQGLTVFFEEFNLSLFCGYQFVNLIVFVFQKVYNLFLFRKWWKRYSYTYQSPFCYLQKMYYHFQEKSTNLLLLGGSKQGKY